MNDQDYQLLIDLFETKNITKVAQQQFLTQPAMTKRIRRIEKDLGCQLILRSKRGVTFTAIGEAVVEHCRKIVHANEELYSTINQYKGVVGGSLCIGCSINYSRYRLPSALRTYQELYPKVDVSVITGHSQKLYHQMLENKLSIAIIRGNFPWNEGSLLLSAEPICLVRSRENEHRALNDYTHIGHHTDSDEEKRIDQWLWDNGVNQNTRIWFDDIVSCREMANAGIGWTIIPSICLDDFPGAVTPIRDKNGDLMLRNTYVLYRSSHYELQQVKLFLEVLAKNEANYPLPSLAQSKIK